MKFSYCLVFVLVSAASIWNISANSRHQLGENAVVTKVNDVSTLKMQGQDIDHHEVVSPPATKGDKRIRGRKMAAERLENHVKVAVEGGVRGNRSSKTALSSSSDLEGKSSSGNVECRQSTGASRFSEKSVDHDDEYAGFVAFSQDYHSPRHHPPKNN